MIPWLKGIDSARPSEFIRRVLLARRLNEMMGTTKYTAYNIGSIPAEDLKELDAWVRWTRELSGGD